MSNILLIDSIPELQKQAGLLVPHFNTAADYIAWNRFKTPEQSKHRVLKEAAERLITGFVEYGDTMFQWDDATLVTNAVQELADFVVYTSEISRRRLVEDKSGE